jgi:putative membrane protein
MNKDELGLARTHLANERTFLAYIRTSLAFWAAGAGMIHFFPSRIMNYTGWFLLIAGAAISIIGALRFVAMKRRISASREQESDR